MTLIEDGICPQSIVLLQAWSNPSVLRAVRQGTRAARSSPRAGSPRPSGPVAPGRVNGSAGPSSVSAPIWPCTAVGRPRAGWPRARGMDGYLDHVRTTRPCTASCRPLSRPGTPPPGCPDGWEASPRTSVHGGRRPGTSVPSRDLDPPPGTGAGAPLRTGAVDAGADMAPDLVVPALSGGPVRSAPGPDIRLRRCSARCRTAPAHQRHPPARPAGVRRQRGHHGRAGG